MGLQDYLLYKVIGSNSDTYPDRTPMFERCVGNVDIRTEKHEHVLKRNWTMCFEFVNYSRFNGQHTWGTCMVLQEERIFTLSM